MTPRLILDGPTVSRFLPLVTRNKPSLPASFARFGKGIASLDSFAAHDPADAIADAVVIRCCTDAGRTKQALALL